MTEFQAQAWICPVCFDDHGGRDCKVDDLKAEIAKLRAEVERWRDRMWATVNERAVWQHDLGEHSGDLPFMPCPSCERDVQADRAEAAESALAAIRTLARSWSGRHDLLMTGDSAAHDIEAALATPTTTDGEAVTTEGDPS